MIKFMRTPIFLITSIYLGVMSGSAMGNKAVENINSAYSWSSQLAVKSNIKYGDQTSQIMDIYLQGKQLGEPEWYLLPEKPVPVLVYIHGGGWVSGNKETRLPFVLPYLANGYIAVNLEYTKGAGTGPAAINDVMKALVWLSTHGAEYRMDLNRVILSGESAGGHLALLAAGLNAVPGRHSDFSGDKLKIRAVVNWYGMTDLEIDEREAKLHSDGKSGNTIWSGLEGEAHQRFVKKWSPATYFDKNMPSVITIQGDKDTFVAMIHAKSMAERLNKIGVHNKLLLMPDANHGGFTEKQFEEAWVSIFSFLNQEINF